MNIAQQLQELLDSTGISRSRLARELGVHTSTVSNWLDGREVKAENLAALCSYFGCTLDYLAGQISKIEKTPTPEGEREIGMDDFTYAFYNESKDLPEEKKKMLLEMARFMKADIDKEKGK